MYLSVFLSLYSRKGGGEDSLYRAYILHTFCKVLKLQEWWYLSVFECLSVTLFTKGGGGRLPVQGPSPPLSTGNWPPPSCTDSSHPGHVQSVQKYIHMLRLKLHSVGEPFILKK